MLHFHPSYVLSGGKRRSKRIFSRGAFKIFTHSKSKLSLAIWSWPLPVLNSGRQTSYDPGPTDVEAPLVVTKVTLGARSYILTHPALVAQLYHIWTVQKPVWIDRKSHLSYLSSHFITFLWLNFPSLLSSQEVLSALCVTVRASLLGYHVITVTGVRKQTYGKQETFKDVREGRKNSRKGAICRFFFFERNCNQKRHIDVFYIQTNLINKLTIKDYTISYFVYIYLSIFSIQATLLSSESCLLFQFWKKKKQIWVCIITSLIM